MGRVGHEHPPLQVSGNIKATEIRLPLQAPGRLIERLVDEGYSVKKDQMLARLDKDELPKIQEQAQASLAQAQPELFPVSRNGTG